MKLGGWKDHLRHHRHGTLPASPGYPHNPCCCKLVVTPYLTETGSLHSRHRCASHGLVAKSLAVGVDRGCRAYGRRRVADLTYRIFCSHDIVEQVLVGRSNDLRLEAECRQYLQHVHSADGLALACPGLERRVLSQRHSSFETHTHCM